MVTSLEFLRVGMAVSDGLFLIQGRVSMSYRSMGVLSPFTGHLSMV